MFVNQSGDCVKYSWGYGADAEISLGRAERNVEVGGGCDDSGFGTQNSMLRSTIYVEEGDAKFIAEPAQTEDELLTTQGFITTFMNVQSKNETVPSLKIQSSVTSRQTVPYE